LKHPPVEEPAVPTIIMATKVKLSIDCHLLTGYCDSQRNRKLPYCCECVNTLCHELKILLFKLMIQNMH